MNRLLGADEQAMVTHNHGRRVPNVPLKAPPAIAFLIAYGSLYPFGFSSQRT